jgi:hypothetical protein
MKKAQPQPAKKSYFFGQGYTDIAAAIKNSWLRNAHTAKSYYAEYELNELMSIKGIYYLFCALSVVTFGTIFFAIISLLTLTVVSILFLLVYIAFSLMWLFDRLYLTRKKIFTACHECKSKFLIPTYICPNCGARHTNLTPGVYGIFRRTCNCGEKLPTTFFNGRKRLQAICPVCLENGKTTILTDRESRPMCVPVVGGRSVGKTAYITAFTRLFVDEVAPSKGLEIEFYNSAKQTLYRKIEADYETGGTMMTPRSNDVSQASSISFSFFVKHKKLKPERLLHIYDIAGEVFTDNNENEVQRQYEYCQGIVFVIDPFAIPSVRARYESMLTPEDRAGIGRADINGVIDVFINKLREVTGLSDSKMSKVPLAVVIGKIDSAGLASEFSEERIKEIQNADPAKPLDRYDAIDLLCRQFLRENGMEGFLQTIDMRFSNNRYFIVSAIGHTRDAGRYRPIGVLEPMEWISTIADKQLGDLWVEHTFSKKTAAKTTR